jgi:N6-L-threonylcarbamoyladenine synthase
VPEFLAFHISGGTTELVHIRIKDNLPQIRRIGGTLDISMGQLIDRLGVEAGKSFPAGGEVDKAALLYKGKREIQKPRGGTMPDFNLSGAENNAVRILTSGSFNAASAFILGFCGEVILAAVGAARKLYGDLPVLFAGGVTCSEYLRKQISCLDTSYFCDKTYCSDNAAGTALLARRKYNNE